MLGKSGFQLSDEAANPKQLIWPITKDTANSVNQSKFEVIIRTRENARMQLVIGFGFASHWLKIKSQANENANYFRDSIEKLYCSKTQSFKPFNIAVSRLDVCWLFQDDLTM